MKYITTYKLFESKSDKVDTYLSKMGSSKMDIDDIFTDLTDLGYFITYDLQYKDNHGRVRSKKSTISETPIIKISVKSNKDTSKFDNISYIESLYHSLSRFIYTYKDNVKIYYEINSSIHLTINCVFDVELDNNKLDINIQDLHNYLHTVLDDLSLDNYTVSGSSVRQESFLRLKMSDSYINKLISEYSKELKKVDSYYKNNVKESDKLCDDIISKFTNTLSTRMSSDIRYIKGSLYLYRDNVEVYEIAKLSCYSGGSKSMTGYLKTGFLSKKYIEIEIYTTIDIEIKII